MSKKNVVLSGALSRKEQAQLWENVKTSVLKAAMAYFQYNYCVNHQLRAYAEDVTQDVLEKIIKKQDTFDSSKAAFKTWVMRVAKNHFHDIHRKNKGLSFVQLERYHLAEKGDDYNFLPEKIIALLKYLSPQEAQLLELKFIQAKTGREIAKIMNMKENTIPMYVKRAKEKLYAIARHRLFTEDEQTSLHEPTTQYSIAA